MCIIAQHNQWHWVSTKHKVAFSNVSTASVMKAMWNDCSYDMVLLFQVKLMKHFANLHIVWLFSAVKKERHHDLCLQFIWSVLPLNDVGRGIRLPRTWKMWHEGQALLLTGFCKDKETKRWLLQLDILWWLPFFNRNAIASPWDMAQMKQWRMWLQKHY